MPNIASIVSSPDRRVHYRVCVSGEQPLLQWDTFGPIVRAAASVHPKAVPLAVAAMGTELAGAAVNIVPVGDVGGVRVSQDQGVLILSASLRLVAQADRRSHSAPCSAPFTNDGLYSQWMHSCFGATAAVVVESGGVQKMDDVAVKPSLPRGRSEQAKDSNALQTHRPEVREAW